MESNSEKVIDFYNNFAERQKKHGINERHFSILKRTINYGLKSNHNVLEIGCGIGTLSSLIIKYLKMGHLRCIDISPENIKIAREQLINFKNIEIIQADATQFLDENKYDVIILPDVIEHIPIEYHNKMFKNLSIMLKNNGFIFIHIPNPIYLEWCHNNKPELLQIIDQPIFTNILLDNILPCGLVISKLETYSIWVKDGDYQYIVLRKKGNEDFSQLVKKKITITNKFIYKIKQLGKR